MESNSTSEQVIRSLNTPIKRAFLVFIVLVLIVVFYFTFSYSAIKTSTPLELPSTKDDIINRHQYSYPINVEDDDIINRHQYSYPINVEDACTKINILVMMPVNSAVTNFHRRDSFRQSRHGKFVKEHGTFIRMLFFVGIPSVNFKNASLYQKQLQDESDTYGDIIQMNVADSYRNLSLKAVGTLNWISKYCSNSQLVLKTDDDVRIDIPTLLSPLYQKRTEYENFVIGHMGVNQKPHRDRNRKDSMSVEEFPNSTYPKFVYGPAEGFPTTTAILLYQQALRTKMIFLDDVFVTGICRIALGIPIFHDKNYITEKVHQKMPSEDFVYSNKL